MSKSLRKFLKKEIIEKNPKEKLAVSDKVCCARFFFSDEIRDDFHFSFRVGEGDW